MARTSGMSRRIIQRMWTRTSCFWSECMMASFLVGLSPALHGLVTIAPILGVPTLSGSQATSVPAARPQSIHGLYDTKSCKNCQYEVRRCFQGFGHSDAREKTHRRSLLVFQAHVSGLALRAGAPRPGDCPRGSAGPRSWARATTTTRFPRPRRLRGANVATTRGNAAFPPDRCRQSQNRRRGRGRQTPEQAVPFGTVGSSSVIEPVAAVERATRGRCHGVDRVRSKAPWGHRLPALRWKVACRSPKRPILGQLRLLVVDRLALSLHACGRLAGVALGDFALHCGAQR